MEDIAFKYNYYLKHKSDINEHLPTLKAYASKCTRIMETGVRGCISSWALLYGLINNKCNEKHLFLNDINPCEISNLLNANEKLSLPVDIKYEWKNNLDLVLTEPFDMVFIDTWHIYGQLKRELEKFAPFTRKYIIMHDTTIDEIYGETIRSRWNAEKQSKESGFPVDEINCGLGKAITEFLENHSEWRLLHKYTNNNGLTILGREGVEA